MKAVNLQLCMQTPLPQEDESKRWVGILVNNDNESIGISMSDFIAHFLVMKEKEQVETSIYHFFNEIFNTTEHYIDSIILDLNDQCKCTLFKNEDLFREDPIIMDINIETALILHVITSTAMYLNHAENYYFVPYDTLSEEAQRYINDKTRYVLYAKESQ